MPASASVAQVKNIPASGITEQPIDKSELLKGYEIEKGRFVTFEPREIAAVRPRTSTEVSITEFVQLAEIDPIFFDASYYAAADTGGEKPYALLFRALAEAGYAALGSLAMHGREHVAVIRPGRHGLILHTLFYENEVRAAEEYRGDPALVNAKELDLAKQFVRALAAPFDPGKLKDKLEERLQELIRARADTAVASYEEGQVPRRAAPVVDIMEALKKSLQMTRKPPASERAPVQPQAKTARVRRGHSRS